MPQFYSLSALAVGLLGLGGASGAAVSYPSSLVASTYFAGFHSNRGFPVSDMPWDKFTDVKYAFAYVPVSRELGKPNTDLAITGRRPPTEAWTCRAQSRIRSPFLLKLPKKMLVAMFVYLEPELTVLSRA